MFSTCTKNIGGGLVVGAAPTTSKMRVNVPAAPQREGGRSEAVEHARWGAVRCDAVRCGRMRCGAVRGGAVQYGVVGCGAYGSVPCAEMRCGEVGVVR